MRERYNSSCAALYLFFLFSSSGNSWVALGLVTWGLGLSFVVVVLVGLLSLLRDARPVLPSQVAALRFVRILDPSLLMLYAPDFGSGAAVWPPPPLALPWQPAHPPHVSLPRGDQP